MSRVPKYCVDLFDYVSGRCSIREESGHMVWRCRNDLIFTWEYCDRHGLDFEAVRKRLNETDEYRDCKVLMNFAGLILDSEVLPNLVRSEQEPSLKNVDTIFQYRMSSNVKLTVLEGI